MWRDLRASQEAERGRERWCQWADAQEAAADVVWDSPLYLRPFPSQEMHDPPYVQLEPKPFHPGIEAHFKFAFCLMVRVFSVRK